MFEKDVEQYIKQLEKELEDSGVNVDEFDFEDESDVDAFGNSWEDEF